MEVILLPHTTTSPAVNFNLEKNIFEISGCSRPEDVVDFYGGIVEWLADLKKLINEELITKTIENPMVFKLKFDYFNSSSAKFILDIVLLINELFLNKLNVKIEWYYKEDDDDMLETGQEFIDIVNCPIDFIAI